MRGFALTLAMWTAACGDPAPADVDSPYGCGVAAANDEPLFDTDLDSAGVFEIDEEDIDNDGDGLTELEGDCDDNNCNVYPEADEYNWGIDSNCDGELNPLYGCGQTSYDSLFPVALAFAMLRPRRAKRPRGTFAGAPT
jgi:hypothetical protein